MMHRRELFIFATAITTAIGCTDGSEPILDDNPEELALCPAQPPIDIDRSLFVSPTIAVEQTQLRARFQVSRIMNHILASANVARPATGAELWQRWWDTQNSSTTQVFTDNPHCSDNGETINGFDVDCPRNEAALAGSQPDSHFPIALVYRPDLAPLDGSSCGEARVVIAKPSDATGRNLPIFEARIPNPNPSCGLAGCRKIAQFWAKLSTINDFTQRLDALERFYFVGLNQAQDGVVTKPVLDASNFGLPDANGARVGQIRTNQFMNGQHHFPLWQLREFKLKITCAAVPVEPVPVETAGTTQTADTAVPVPVPVPVCKLFFEPVSDKTNPRGFLFNDLNPDPRGPGFRAEFLNQIGSLSSQDLNAIGMSVTNTFNAGQSSSQGTENEYLTHLVAGANDGFEQDIQDKLTSMGSTLTPAQIALRATTQSCAGCHMLSANDLLGGNDAQGLPLRWPAVAPGGFVHTTEGGIRSPALNNVFLPKRKQILEKFLLDTCRGLCPIATDPVPVSTGTLAGKDIVH